MCSQPLLVDSSGVVVDTEDPWVVEQRHAALAVAGPPGGFAPFDWEIAGWRPEPVEGDPVPPASAMTEKGLLDEIARLEQEVGRAQARQVQMLAALSRRRTAYVATADPNDMPEIDYWAEQVADEVAARVCWTRWQANRRTEEARRLELCLPATLAKLEAGLVDYSRVRVVVAATEHLNPADAAAVDAAVADRLGDLTTGQLREVLAREIIAVDTDAARRREEAATARRTVHVRPLDDAQAELDVVGPADQVQGIAEGLDILAGPSAGPGGRPLGARRFDALAAAVDDAVQNAAQGEPEDPGAGVEGTPEPGSRRRRSSRAQVLVGISLNTLIGLDDHPAELAGYGPIPAHVAREIARHGVLRRLLTDPITGIVVSVDGHVHPNGYTPDEPDPPDEPNQPHGDGPDDSDPPGGDDPAGDDPPGDPGTRDADDSEPSGGSSTGGCPVQAAGGGLYRPRLALDRLIRLREQTCSAIGCRLRAEKCDLDHIIAHPDGPTCACNLHPLCRRHHGMKHHTGWHVVRLQDGSRLWTSPTGHTYLRPARPFLEPPRAKPPSRRERDAFRSNPRAVPGYPASTTTIDETAPPPF